MIKGQKKPEYAEDCIDLLNNLVRYQSFKHTSHLVHGLNETSSSLIFLCQGILNSSRGSDVRALMYLLVAKDVYTTLSPLIPSQGTEATPSTQGMVWSFGAPGFRIHVTYTLVFIACRAQYYWQPE